MRFFGRAGVVTLMMLCCLCGWSPRARAGIADAPGAELQVSLITYGPGDIYWERFGHDAIELRDNASGEAVTFNYGVFDFDESGFLLNFARGYMHYLMDAATSAEDQSYYVSAGRSITRQPLAFTPEQAANLRDFLLWNLRPENAGYNYNYYADNCATRVRDALDKALGGALKPQLQARPGGMTYREQTARLMSNQAWLMLLMDLGLGPYADQPLNAWQESFLPVVLHDEVRHLQVKDAQGTTYPLVLDEQLLSPNKLVPPPDHAPDLRLPLAITGLCIAALLLLARRVLPVGYAVLGTAYLLFAGLAGIILLALWTLTQHHSAWANANLLLFNPLDLVLLPALWRSRRGVAPGWKTRALLVLRLLAIVATLLLHLLPGVVQQNQPWILFAMPIWLVLAWGLLTPNKKSHAWTHSAG